MQKYVISAENNFLKKLVKDINHCKVTDHCHYTGKYRGAAHSFCNLAFNVSIEISVVFHKGSNYDCHFIVEELTNKFDNQFECIGEKHEKYKTFPVPIKKRSYKNPQRWQWKRWKYIQ